MKAMVAEKNYKSSFYLYDEKLLSANMQIEVCSENRSNDYINWVKNLDKNHNIGTQQCESQIEIQHRELGFTRTKIIPKFVISRCHLGFSHDIHLVDFCNGQHIIHLKISDVLPAPLQNARILAKNYNYAFVEVYEDKILLVR